MRIFLCCQQDLRLHAVPAYRFWAGYFRSALAEAGHECLEAPDCDWAEGLLSLDAAARSAWLGRTWTRAFEWLRSEHSRRPVDLFLAYLFPQQIESSALDSIRSLGIPCVNFFCDNVREFRQLPATFRGFDLHWVPEFKAVPLYRRAGWPWLHAPMACWVPPAWRTPGLEKSATPAFVGTRDPLRAALFAEAIVHGLTVELRGVGWGEPVSSSSPGTADPTGTWLSRQHDFVHTHGWAALVRKCSDRLRPAKALNFDFGPYARPSPVGDDYWRTLRDASVCLGVNRYPSPRFTADRPDTYSRLRDLEAPMAGACYLTEWTEGLGELYELGREIETYGDAVELAEKSRALAADAPRRAALRAAGQRRALAEHTIAHTLEAIARRLRCNH